MACVPQEWQNVPHILIAVLLLLAQRLSKALELPCPSVEQIVAATGVSRSQMFEVAVQVQPKLAALVRGVGRPEKPMPQPSDASKALGICQSLLAYVSAHPGSVQVGKERTGYSDGYRQHVMKFTEGPQALGLEELSQLLNIPLGTLKSWQRQPSQAEERVPKETTEPEEKESQETSKLVGDMATVVSCWKNWEGTFVGFCDYLKKELKLTLGKEMISRILEIEGARIPERRAGRSPDEIALRKSFDTFFAGAQWVGDGKTVIVEIDGIGYKVNLELMVDAKTGAMVGISVRDEEDSQAVTEAYVNGIQTTGTAPLAVTLDNKPSNHTEEVTETLGETLKIRSTLRRPQNKAHVEGAFGLFSQQLPPLVITTTEGPQNQAKQLCGILASVWARLTNGRARKDRKGQSRIDLYKENVTPEQIEKAYKKLKEIKVRQDKSYATQQARQEPVVIDFLDKTVERLNLQDPDRQVRIALGRYPLDAIVSGVAIFEAKRTTKTLDDAVDIRYLLGIVKNVSAKQELEHLAESLWRLRSEVIDSQKEQWENEKRKITQESQSVEHRRNQYIDRALKETYPRARQYWLQAVEQELKTEPQAERQDWFRKLAKRIGTTYSASVQVRQDALRQLSEWLLPLI